MRPRILLLSLLNFVLVACAGVPSSPATALDRTHFAQSAPAAKATRELSDQRLNSALPASIQIGIFKDGQIVSSGSGTLLTRDGLILTNLHTVGNLHTRELADESGTIVIAIADNPRRSAQPQYIADIVQTAFGLDLAILRLSATLDGEPLPPTLDLPFVRIGNSDKLNIGDAVSAIGFPDVEGKTATVSRGFVTGFGTDDDGGEQWIKTNIVIAPGSSGGMVLNAEGKIIGVATAVVIDETSGGQTGMLRPINLARDGIVAALIDEQPLVPSAAMHDASITALPPM